jgi:PPK2 family polyphosphate:nucleotide phosphotransferase
MNHKPFLVPPGKKIDLERFDTASTGSFKSKKDALKKLRTDVERMSVLQDVLYAHNVQALLLIFQAMDAAGKDSAIKHVMSGVNPQGCQVTSFKAPSAEELDHDYLWRCAKRLPERGRIGIFNRSYYEEVLVVRVHPELLKAQKLPNGDDLDALWNQRFEEINNFEKYIAANGIIPLKFFLHVSKAEQKRRFLKRINTPEKNWKFDAGDVRERGFWKQYMKAYEELFRRTSTPWAPWYIIPADHKWYTRVVVADIVVRTLEALKLRYPEPAPKHRKELIDSKRLLESE